MKPGKVVIRGADWDRQPPGPGSWLLWYFGADYARFVSWGAEFGKECAIKVAPIGDALDAAAEELREEVIELDDRLDMDSACLAWISSDIAERNPLTSRFYLDLSRCVALVQAARAGGQHIVVLEDVSTGHAMAETCRRAGIAAEWRGPRRSLLQYLHSLLRSHALFLRNWAAERFAIRRHPSAPGSLKDRSPWILSWSDGSGLGANASRDRFFGGFPGWLRARGFRPGWLANPARWMAPIDKIAANAATASEPALLIGAFTGVGALLRAYAALASFFAVFRKGLELRGIDLTPLLRHAVWRELASSRLVSAALYAGLARGLRRRGLSPRVLFYTYENQPWEKAMVAGFRRTLPETILVGVQHAPLAKRYLSAHPGRKQWQCGIAPDLLVTIGREFRDRLIALGASPERILVGGALRFPNIRARRAPRAPTAGEARMVLVSTSVDLEEAIELTHKAVIATDGLDNLRLVVNFHPMVNEEFRASLRKQIAEMTTANHIEFVGGAAESWLEKADILLYSASGTAFEAAAAGVPSIFVGSDLLLDLDKMSGYGGLKCRHPEELRLHIENLLADPELSQSLAEKSRRYVEQCFAEPVPEFWVDLVQQALGGRPHPGQQMAVAG